MHKHIILFVALFACPLIVGCGSSSSGGGGFSCDIKTAGIETCSEYDNLPAADTSTVQSECTAAKGTARLELPDGQRARRLRVISAGGISYSETYYKATGLTAATASAGCKTAGGKWTAS